MEAIGVKTSIPTRQAIRQVTAQAIKQATRQAIRVQIRQAISQTTR